MATVDHAWFKDYDSRVSRTYLLLALLVTGPLFGSIATQILEFDEYGKYVREIGQNQYGFGDLPRRSILHDAHDA
jgi:hypothetical protein